MQLLVVSHQIIAELNISSKEGAVASIQLNHPYVLDALLDICEAPSEPASRTSLISTLAKAAAKRVDDWELVSSRLVQRGLCSDRYRLRRSNISSTPRPGGFK